MTPLIEIAEFYRAHKAMHVLWTKAVGTSDYNKQEWKELDNAMVALARSLQ